MPKSKPPYPAEFKQQIVELARVGKTPAQLSREFGCSAQTISNWIAQEAIDRGKPLPGKAGLSPGSRLRTTRIGATRRLGAFRLRSSKGEISTPEQPSAGASNTTYPLPVGVCVACATPPMDKSATEPINTA